MHAGCVGTILGTFSGQLDAQPGRIQESDEPAGNYVSLFCGDATVLYGHLDKEIEASTGDSVTTDTILGYVGNSGRSSEPHLHIHAVEGRVRNKSDLLYGAEPVLMLRLAPDVASKIEQIVFMGGSTDYGNDSPAAEFNLLCDPHAAQIVLDADIPKIMFGLNVTHQVIATPQRVQAMRDIGNDAGRVFADMSVFFEKVYRERYGFKGSALHDPCTVAWLLKPELFATRKMRVDVETNQGISFGRTVHDIWNLAGKECNTEVALRADSNGFFELLNSLLVKFR
nr:nucleoside hydrolase [Pseudovibrio axinellae]